MGFIYYLSETAFQSERRQRGVKERDGEKRKREREKGNEREEEKVRKGEKEREINAPDEGPLYCVGSYVLNSAGLSSHVSMFYGDLRCGIFYSINLDIHGPYTITTRPLMSIFVPAEVSIICKPGRLSGSKGSPGLPFVFSTDVMNMK